MRKLAALLVVLLLLPVYFPVRATPVGGDYVAELQNNATVIYNFLENHSTELGISNESLAQIKGNLTLAENQSNETIKIQYLNQTIYLELNVSADAIREKKEFWANVSSTLSTISVNCSEPVRELVANLTNSAGMIESIKERFNGTVNSTEVIITLNNTLRTFSHSDEIVRKTAECLVTLVEKDRNQTENELSKIRVETEGLIPKVESLINDSKRTESALESILNTTKSGSIGLSMEKLKNITAELQTLKENLESLKNEANALNASLDDEYNSTIYELRSTTDVTSILRAYASFKESQENVSEGISLLRDKLREFNGTYIGLKGDLKALTDNATVETRTLIKEEATALQKRIGNLYSSLTAKMARLQNITNITPALQGNLTAITNEIDRDLNNLEKWNSTLAEILGNTTSTDLESMAAYLKQIADIRGFINGINESKISLEVDTLLESVGNSGTTSSSTTTTPHTTTTTTNSTSGTVSTTPPGTNSTTSGKSGGGGIVSKIKGFLVLILKGIALVVGALAALIVGVKAYYLFQEKSRERKERKRIEEIKRSKEEEKRRHQEIVNLMKESLSDIKRESKRLGLLSDIIVLEKLRELEEMVREAERAFRISNYRRVRQIKEEFAKKVEELNSALRNYGKTLKLDLGSHVAANSYIGRRENNEDSYIAEKVGGNILLAVADGMGGHLAGEVASKKAIEVLKETLEANRFGDPVEILRKAIHRANEEIYKMGHDPDHPEWYKMGTTLTATIVRGDTATVGNVGDSRTYLIRDGTITRLTKDHSLVQELIDRGEITEEEARKHPQKNIITKALGIEEELKLEPEDIKKIALKPGDYLLLCSDGLSDALTDKDILNTVMNARSLQDAVKFLIEKAYSMGSSDNITVVLYRH